MSTGYTRTWLTPTSFLLIFCQTPTAYHSPDGGHTVKVDKIHFSTADSHDCFRYFDLCPLVVRAYCRSNLVLAQLVACSREHVHTHPKAKQMMTSKWFRTTQEQPNRWWRRPSCCTRKCQTVAGNWTSVLSSLELDKVKQWYKIETDVSLDFMTKNDFLKTTVWVRKLARAYIISCSKIELLVVWAISSMRLRWLHVTRCLQFLITLRHERHMGRPYIIKSSINTP